MAKPQEINLIVNTRTQQAIRDLDLFTTTLKNTQSQVAKIQSLRLFNRELSSVGLGLKKVGEQTRYVDLATGRFVSTSKAVSMLEENLTKSGRSTHDMNVQFRGFRMEMLSVMFFGMALNRVFGTHVQRVNEMIGVTDMWNAVADDMLLQYMLPMTEQSFALADAFMGLPEPVKAGMGAVMFWTTQAGTALSTISQITLGADGLARGWQTTFKPAIEKIAKAFGVTGLKGSISDASKSLSTLLTRLGIGGGGLVGVAPIAAGAIAAIAGGAIVAYTAFSIWNDMMKDSLERLTDFNKFIEQHPELEKTMGLALFGQETISTMPRLQYKHFRATQEYLTGMEYAARKLTEISPSVIETLRNKPVTIPLDLYGGYGNVSVSPINTTNTINVGGINVTNTAMELDDILFELRKLTNMNLGTIGD